MNNTIRERIGRTLDELRDLIALLRGGSRHQPAPKPVPVRIND